MKLTTVRCNTMVRNNCTINVSICELSAALMTLDAVAVGSQDLLLKIIVLSVPGLCNRKVIDIKKYAAKNVIE